MLSRNVVRGAHKAAASSTSSKPVEKVSKLGNGLTVATVDSKKPITQLVLAFRAGSRYETPAQAGLSHTLRNFVGRDSKDHFGSAIVWSASTYGGVVKSFTSRDLFGVSLTVPRDSTSYALHVLAQAAAVPGFKPWEIEDVLPTMRADNGFRTAYDLVVDQIHKAAYRNGGLGNSVYAPCSKIGAICTNSLTAFAVSFSFFFQDELLRRTSTWSMEMLYSSLPTLLTTTSPSSERTTLQSEPGLQCPHHQVLTR
ncbi:unnamed protein product [Caenorhabditis nigoni]